MSGRKMPTNPPPGGVRPAPPPAPPDPRHAPTPPPGPPSVHIYLTRDACAALVDALDEARDLLQRHQPARLEQLERWARLSRKVKGV